MTEIMEKEQLEAGRIERVTCYAENESQALEGTGEEAQIKANQRGHPIAVVNEKREVVGRAFPVSGSSRAFAVSSWAGCLWTPSGEMAGKKVA